MVAIVPAGVAADDLLRLLEALPDADRPTAIVIGERPPERRGTRANEKKTFISQLLTGEKISDFNSPLRLYPTRLLMAVPDKIRETPWFGLEILIFGSRSGYAIRQVEVGYAGDAAAAEEIPGTAYLISKLLALLSPVPRKRLCDRNFQREAFKEFLTHPLKFISFLLKENASPAGLAAAAATGMFFGTLPLPGLHTALIIYVSVKLRLNKVMSVNISHLCMPPFVPIACLELGHFALNGEWLVFDSMRSVLGELRLRLLEWLIGAAILAPLNALFFWCLTYAVAKTIASRLKPDE
jgi:uncharacterized protein (DUF2062 family)